MPRKSQTQPAEPEPDDYYDASRPDGRVLLVVDGEKHYLGRPKIGLLHRLEELLADIQAAERETAQWQIEQFGVNFEEIQAYRESGTIPSGKAERLMEIATKVDAHKMVERKRQVDDMRVGWWHDHVFPKLCPALAEIDTDDLPAYLAGVDIINESLRTWAGNPQVPGGR